MRNPLPKTVAAVFALVLLSLPALAQEDTVIDPTVRAVSPEVAQAVEALKADDGQRAAAFLRPVAEKGDPSAQALLGQLYLEGIGIDKDLYEAGRWLRSAAANGEPAAAFALAELTVDKTLTPPGFDPADTEGLTKEATRLYLLAASNGSIPGQVETGLRYAQGIGTAQNFLEASRWFREAANAGSPVAQFNLGALHATGALNSGAPDHASALPWFEKAAAQGHPDAQYNLGLTAAQGLGREVDNTIAARWFAAAAGHGMSDAQAGLAYLTYQGLGVAKDETKAADLYALAAEKGHLIAQNRLARLYVMGRGVEADLAEAWKWHSLATRAGFDDAELDTRFTKFISPQQRSDGDARAAKWLEGKARQ
ncbi:MAG: hypothetical protein ACFB0Z_12540 [Candidatus Phaeomarinobacter sp.]